jgi:hypothetical protein
MPTLASELRNKLERVVIDARDAAEIGANAALEALAVHHHAAYPHMKPAQIELRNHLRARALQLGDRKLPKLDAKGKDLDIGHLTDECAYEHWHRMLFARFLAENSLLIEPQEKMAISLSEAEELAKEDGVNVWVFASRCAQGMLPQIFRPDDPLLQVSFAIEHMLKLEKLLASLPQTVFTASDALGWVYQFWQSKKKDEVNRSEVKIGADEIAAVTQLFTEPYMVEFLLHNTLGAWWAGKKLAANDAASAKTEDELRRKFSLPGVSWEYLRFTRGADGKSGPWRPAAGTFEGWPKNPAELKVLDPCCGSGHFLVAALHHLTPIRMTEESLNARDAIDAVLRDNLHGLEIDERCCQIAAFAVALAAWTYPGAGGYRALPELKIACTGIAPHASKEQWLKLGEEIAAKGGMPADRNLFGAEESLLSGPIKKTMEALHELFSQAPVLGSLINPTKLRADLFHADYKSVAPLLSAVLGAQRTDDEIRERAIAAAGMAKAADLLGGKYTLVITNVPYLVRGKQGDTLKEFCEDRYPEAKPDLATAMMERCSQFTVPSGTIAIVILQYWLFLATYRKLRKRVLTNSEWQLVAQLGDGAFDTISGAVVNVALMVMSSKMPSTNTVFSGLDADDAKGCTEKSTKIQRSPLVSVSQVEQLENPDHRILLSGLAKHTKLGDFAIVSEGLHTGDYPRFGRKFWEVSTISGGWTKQQAAPSEMTLLGGREHILFWQDGSGDLIKYVQERLGGQSTTMWIKGDSVWGKSGVAVSAMSDMRATLYTGELFTHGAIVIVPKHAKDLPAIWAFASSPEFNKSVRVLDKKVCVARGSVDNVPFDYEHWKIVGQALEPLKNAKCTDPTQWAYSGQVSEATAPLQVAVAKLLGYGWPGEARGSADTSKHENGIICIPSVRGESPAADRLEALLAVTGIKAAKARGLAGGVELDDWLRNSFFEEHCKLFDHRPFVWHVWDGRKRDGFHALVSYHKLCEGKGKGRKILESLTYSYLGDWITRQNDGVKRGEGGAEDRLAAAVELQNRLRSILVGEPPFDLFVRWKELAEQPIGWEPDINDGVRLNIRPFLASDLPGGRTGAGVLRWKPNIKWDKDRGTEPERAKAEYPWFWNWNEKTVDFMGTGREPDGNRWNDCHYTIKAKQTARDAAKKGGK